MLAFQRCDVGGAKKERMEQRLSTEAKGIIEQAARLQGVEVSVFVVSHVVMAARETIAKLGATVLQPADVRAFMQAFEDNQPNGELVNLFALHEEVMATDGDR